MGIPYLFHKLLKKFHVHHTTLHIRDNTYCNNLYIDFNAILHTVLSELKDYHDFYWSLERTLLEIISITRPSSIIYIATDGVPPKAKMIQQRYRRYISASKETQAIDNNYKSYTLKTHQELSMFFDKNQISPGTQFMQEVSDFIKNTFIPRYKKNNNSIRFIYSTDTSPSEGEHKIISYIKKNYNLQQTHIIYGMDADLITLSMLVENKKITLLRKTKNGDHTMIQSRNISKNIFENIQKQVEYLDLEEKNVIIDINYLMFFLGNDFIPYLFELNLNNHGLDLIFECYIELLKSYPCYIINNNYINYKQLYNFFMLVCKKIDNPILENTDCNTFDYLKTSYWTLIYYNKCCPTYDWGYCYIKPPSIMQILNCIKNNIAKLSSIRFEYTVPISPIEQLLFILPKNSIRNILGEKYNNLIENNKDYYPDTFTVYYPKDILVEWQSRCILPEMNLNKFKNVNLNIE